NGLKMNEQGSYDIIIQAGHISVGNKLRWLNTVVKKRQVGVRPHQIVVVEPCKNASFSNSVVDIHTSYKPIFNHTQTKHEYVAERAMLLFPLSSSFISLPGWSTSCASADTNSANTSCRVRGAGCVERYITGGRTRTHN